jgi:hypothetical protein
MLVTRGGESEAANRMASRGLIQSECMDGLDWIALSLSAPTAVPSSIHRGYRHPHAGDYGGGGTRDGRGNTSLPS